MYRSMRGYYIFAAVMCLLFFGSAAAIVWSVNNGHEAGMVEIVVWVGRVGIVFGLGLIAVLLRRLWKLSA